MPTLNETLTDLRDIFAKPPTPSAWSALYRRLTSDGPDDPASLHIVQDYAREHIAQWWPPGHSSDAAQAWTWERSLTLGLLLDPGDDFAPLRDMLAAWRLTHPLKPSDGLTEEEHDRVCAALGATEALPAVFDAWLREAGHIGPQDAAPEPLLYYPALADLTQPSRRDGYGHEAALETAQTACEALGWTLDGRTNPDAPVAFAYDPGQDRLFALDRSTSPPSALSITDGEFEVPPARIPLDQLARFYVAWIAGLGSSQGIERDVPVAALGTDFATPLATLGSLAGQPDLSLHAFALVDTIAVAVFPSPGGKIEPFMPADLAHASFGLRHDPKQWPHQPAPWWVRGALPDALTP